MDFVLNIEIYGLRVRIDCPHVEDMVEVARLLAFFLKDDIKEADATVEFARKATPQEIGRLLFPHLSKKGIWAMHAGGFQFHGGYLTIGPSGSGKSTFSHAAMKSGLFILSDDITLMRDSADGIEILPFYSTVYLKDKMIIPDPDIFKPATLKVLLLPQANNGSILLKKVDRKIDILKRTAPQLLWSYDKHEQKKQNRFLEKMCDYPAYEVYWGPELFHDANIFRGILDEIVQSEG